jgi:hypothetical protein
MSAVPADRRSTRLPRIALAWSLACSGLAAWWVSDPSRNPLHTSDEPVSLLGLLQPRTGALVCLAFGLLATAVAARLVRASRGRVPTGVIGLGAATCVFFGAVAPDIQLLAFLGYAMALLGGPVLVGLLLAGARRHRVNLVALALIGTAVGVGVVTGHIGSPTLELLDEIRAGSARVGVRPLVIAFLACGGVLLGATVLAVTGGGTSRASRERLARWGRVATIVAALGPLPYGLIRMTWATPWPQGLGGGSEAILEAGIRVFGLCLGLSALCGSVLTLGLLACWGEVWPGWLPGLRGRPVPVKAAVIPASLVAVALCAASVSLVVLSVREGGAALLLMIPAPVWGPALLLAAYAYYRRRTDPPLSEPDPDFDLGSSRSHGRAVS